MPPADGNFDGLDCECTPSAQLGLSFDASGADTCVIVAKRIWRGEHEREDIRCTYRPVRGPSAAIRAWALRGRHFAARYVARLFRAQPVRTRKAPLDPRRQGARPAGCSRRAD